MQSILKDHLCLFVADSRANNFNLYQQPPNLNLYYVIQRGATIDQLIKRTHQEILKLNIQKQHVLVKIAAGINDILNKHQDHTGVHIKLSSYTAENIIDKLLTFRSVVKTLIPTALVGFVTIPTAHLPSIQQHNLQAKKTELSSAQSPDSLEKQQSSLNLLINDINARIRILNSSKQTGCVRGCWTVSWHTFIAKQHIKRSGKGRTPKKHTRYMYDKLYNGLHAKSDVKKIWFELLVKAFAAEIEYVTCEQDTVSFEIEDISSSESESDFILDVSTKYQNFQDNDDDDDMDRPWKRIK